MNMIVLIIILVIFAVVLYFIKTESDKHKVSTLDIETKQCSDFIDDINAVAVNIIKKEYESCGKKCFRDSSMAKSPVLQYNAEFTSDAKNKHQELLQMLEGDDGKFDSEFILYIQCFYPDATMQDFKEILEEFIIHPKKIPKKFRMEKEAENKPSEEIVESEVIDETPKTLKPDEPEPVKTLEEQHKEAVQKVLSKKPNNVITNRNRRDTECITKPPVERCMLHKEFVRLSDVSKFEKSFISFFGFSELSGIYLIYNASKRKWFIGQGQRALQKCLQIFKSPNSSVPDLQKDWNSGDIIFINFIRLKDTDYNTLDELEFDYIEKYDCIMPKGYNRSRGTSRF